MVGVEILLEVRPEKRGEFIQAMATLEPSCSGDTSCLSHGVFQAFGEENRFLWIEYWADKGALQHRLRSGPFKALLGAVRVLSSEETVNLILATPWDERRAADARDANTN